MAGVERFELPDDGVRVRSLTAWRHPNIFLSTQKLFFKKHFKKHVSQLTFLFYTLSLFFASVLIRFLELFYFFVGLFLLCILFKFYRSKLKSTPISRLTPVFYLNYTSDPMNSSKKKESLFPNRVPVVKNKADQANSSVRTGADGK